MNKQRNLIALHKAIMAFWQEKNLFAYALVPLSWLFQIICFLRYQWYTRIKARQNFNIPIIVVGNISLGGTGKTPLVEWLARALLSHGYQPGIVMRGYQSQAEGKVLLVNQESPSDIVGDEACLLAKATGLPLAIGKNRPQAVAQLLRHYPKVNVVISDDGLQHYALKRDIEILVIDGKKRLGNGLCLPAGPLRESPKRLQKVDYVIINGQGAKDEWSMSTTLSDTAYSVDESKQCAINEFIGKTVHAVAGIGHPERFFMMLRDSGIDVIEHAFIDHYQYRPSDLAFKDYPIMMTQKDAVKCRNFAPDAWYIPLEVTLPEEFIHDLLRRMRHGQKIAGHSSLSHLQTTSGL